MPQIPENHDQLPIRSGSTGPKKTPEEMAAAGQTAQNLETSHRQTEAQEHQTGETKWLDCLVDNEFFGVDPRDPDRMVVILQDLADELGCDITNKDQVAENGYTFEDIALEFQDRCQKTEKKEVTAGIQETTAGKKEKETKSSTVEAFINEKVAGKQGMERLRAIEELMNEPALILAGLQKPGSSMAALPDGFEGTRQAVRNRIEALSLVANTSPKYAEELEKANVDPFDSVAVIVFVASSGFFEDESIDENTKATVRAKLGIAETHEADTSSGTDLKRSLSDGYGTDTTGNKVPFTKENPLKMRDGVDVYEETPGEYRMDLQLNDRVLKVEFSDKFSAEDIQKVTNYIMMVHTFEKMGLTETTSCGHLKDFIVMMIATASRPDAILELTFDRCDFDNGLLILNAADRVQTKKYRPTVKMPDSVVPYLRLLESRNNSEYVINYLGRPVKNPKKTWKATRAKAGLDDQVNPYSLRHTMARHLRRTGVPAWETAAQLGHKTRGVSTTEIYAPFDPSYLTKAESAIDAFFCELACELRVSEVADILRER